MVINFAFDSELKTALSLKQIYLAPFWMNIFKDNCFDSVVNGNFHGQFIFKFDLLVQQIAFCFEKYL